MVLQWTGEGFAQRRNGERLAVFRRDFYVGQHQQPGAADVIFCLFYSGKSDGKRSRNAGIIRPGSSAGRGFRIHGIKKRGIAGRHETFHVAEIHFGFEGGRYIERAFCFTGRRDYVQAEIAAVQVGLPGSDAFPAGVLEISVAHFLGLF